MADATTCPTCEAPMVLATVLGEERLVCVTAVSFEAKTPARLEAHRRALEAKRADGVDA